jgi:hypothetical protein
METRTIRVSRNYQPLWNSGFSYKNQWYYKKSLQSVLESGLNNTSLSFIKNKKMSITNRLIRLASNESTDLFPNNTLTSFTNVLDNPLHLINEVGSNLVWCANLASITFNTTFSNLPPFLEDCKPHFVAASFTSHFHRQHGLRSEDSRQEISLPDDCHYRHNDVAATLDDLFQDHLHGRIQFEATADTPLRFSGDNIVLLIHPRVADFLKLLFTPHILYDYGGVDYLLFRFAPRRLDIDEEQVWFQGSEPFSLTYRVPLYVRIVLPSLQSRSGSINCAQTLATIPFDHTALNSSFFHEVRRWEHVQLLNVKPTSISVILLDDLGKQLRLTSGQPTLITMNFSQKYQADFFLPVSSKDMEAEGINSNFKIARTMPLMLTSNSWKVALSSIMFPSRFQNITQGDLEKDHIIMVQDSNRTISRLELSHFASEDILVQAVSDFVWEASEHCVRISRTDHHRLRIKLEHQKEVENTSIIFDGKIAALLGLTNWQYPSAEFRLKREGSSINGGYMINLNLLAPAAMYVHLDMVEPEYIPNNKLRKVLKMISVNRARDVGHMQCYQSSHLEYIPIMHSVIPNFSLKLEQTDGEDIAFVDPTEEVIYNLHFIRRK